MALGIRTPTTVMIVFAEVVVINEREVGRGVGSFFFSSFFSMFVRRAVLSIGLYPNMFVFNEKCKAFHL